MARTPRGRLPATAIIGLLGMAVLGGWSFVEYRERSAAHLGGRIPVAAPAWAAAHYAEVCQLARRCDTPWPAIRWFAVDSSALPDIVCPGAVGQYREIWGCWEQETRALTLVRAAYADTVIVRHELLHAALGPRYAGRHPCPWFHVQHRTLAPDAWCEL